MANIELLFKRGLELQNIIDGVFAHVQAQPIDGFHQSAWILAHLQKHRQERQDILKKLSTLVEIDQEIKLESGQVVALKQSDNGRLSVAIIE